MDAMLWFADRWWRFPGAQIDLESEFEWRCDGTVRLHAAAGKVVEGRELSEAEIEQTFRETSQICTPGQDVSQRKERASSTSQSDMIEAFSES
jgi:hypothetical protein